MFYLTTHSTHFIYSYMMSDIIMVMDHSDSERGKPLPPSHRLDSTHHDPYYTSRGTLAETRNSSMGPPQGINK